MLLRSILVAVSLCCVAFIPGGPTVAADQTYDIDVILPLTGTFANAGHDINESLGVALDYVNRTGGIAGRPVRFLIHDDQTNPQLALQLGSAVIAKHPAVLIGPVVTASCNALFPLVKNGPVEYCISPGVYPPVGGYAFSSGFAAQDLNDGILRYLRERGWKRLAKLFLTDASGQDVEKGLDLSLARPENRDIAVVANEHFNPGDLSVAAQLARIKASGAQVMIAWQTGPPTAMVLRGANDISLDMPVVVSSANATYAQMHQLGSFIPPAGLYFPDIPAMAPSVITDRATRAAVEVFRSSLIAHNIRPGYVHASIWDPVLLVVDALRKLGPDATAAQLYTYIQNLRHWTGVNGPYDFRTHPDRGVGSGQAVIVRWDKDRDDFVPVSSVGGSPLQQK